MKKPRLRRGFWFETEFCLLFGRKNFVHAGSAFGAFALHGAAALFTEGHFLCPFGKFPFFLTFYAVTLHSERVKNYYLSLYYSLL